MSSDTTTFTTYDNKAIGTPTGDEPDLDSNERSDPSSGLDGKGHPIGTPDPNSKACIVNVDGTLLDYGTGCGSRDDSVDYSEGKSYEHGFSTTAATEIAYYATSEYDNSSLKEKHPKYNNIHSKFEYLNRKYHRGTTDDNRQKQECESEYFALVRVFAAKLNLDGPFVHEAGKLLAEYDCRKEGEEYALQRVALGALSLAHEEYFNNAIPKRHRNENYKNVGKKDDGYSVKRRIADYPHSMVFNKEFFHSWNEIDGDEYRAQPIHQTRAFQKLLNDYGLDEDEIELNRIQRKLKNTDVYQEIYMGAKMTMENSSAAEDKHETEPEVVGSVELKFLEYAGGGEITAVECLTNPMISSNDTSVASA